MVAPFTGPFTSTHLFRCATPFTSDPGSSNPTTLEQQVANLATMMIGISDQFTTMRREFEQLRLSNNERLDRLETYDLRPPLVNHHHRDNMIIPNQGHPHDGPRYQRETLTVNNHSMVLVMKGNTLPMTMIMMNDS